MPRGQSNQTVVEPEDVDVPDATEEDETDVVDTPSGEVKEVKTGAAKTAKNPRWTPPEGYVTLVGAAKVITAKKLYFPRGSEEPGELPSQQMYSLARGASKIDPFPLVYFNDDGSVSETPTDHQAVKVDDIVSWWERTNDRVKTKAANAKAKAANKSNTGNENAPAAGTVEEATEDDEVTEKFDSDSAQASEAVEAE
jgi:hypothetical protein